MVRVAIIQKQIPHYRVAFFTEIQSQALDAGMEVTVYSAEEPDNRVQGNFQYKVLPRYSLDRSQTGVYWLKGLGAAIRGSDVIVAPMELQCLNTPYLWMLRRWLCKCWIWWGHGYNFQSKGGKELLPRLKELAKGFMTRRADGLITYTSDGARYWTDRGLPRDRVIPFFNTIHVEGLRKKALLLPEKRLMQIRQQLALEGKQILLFSGRLYRMKEVDFLLRAFSLLQKECVNVALLILGDGPERPALEALASRMGLRHVHFLGEFVIDDEVGAFFLLADLLVIPGLVGLAIVHGFAFGLPLVTTRRDFHSPEIEYLSGENGTMTEHDESIYSREIGTILNSPARLQAMRAKAKLQGDRLLLTDSVRRFVNGIKSLAGNLKKENAVFG